jgi:ribonuclease T2
VPRRRSLSLLFSGAWAAILIAAAMGGARAQQPSSSFDHYALALSWAPTFCEGASAGGEECASGADLGFVLHGLWPESESGYVENCARVALTRHEISAAVGLYPSVRLALHEWNAHGTCAGLTPAAYFDAVRRARARVATPAAFAGAPPARASTDEIARAFAAANPGLEDEDFAVACRRGALEEVRVCLSQDLRDFHDCPEVVRRSCQAGSLRIPAPQ